MTGIKSKIVMAGLAVLALAACGSGLTPAQLAQQSRNAAADESMAATAYAAANASDAAASQAAASIPQPSTALGSPQPSTEPSAQKAAAARVAAEKKAAAERAHAIHEARLAAENTPISAAQWGMVIRNPDNYTGDIYTISGTVTEYNIDSNTLATQESAALVAEDSNGNDFVVEAPASLLGNVQPGDTFSAKVTVLGSEEAENTVYGGTSEVPDFDASTFTITG